MRGVRHLLADQRSSCCKIQTFLRELDILFPAIPILAVRKILLGN